MEIIFNLFGAKRFKILLEELKFNFFNFTTKF